MALGSAVKICVTSGLWARPLGTQSEGELPPPPVVSPVVAVAFPPPLVELPPAVVLPLLLDAPPLPWGLPPELAELPVELVVAPLLALPVVFATLVLVAEPVVMADAPLVVDETLWEPCVPAALLVESEPASLSEQATVSDNQAKTQGEWERFETLRSIGSSLPPDRGCNQGRLFARIPEVFQSARILAGISGSGAHERALSVETKSVGAGYCFGHIVVGVGRERQSSSSETASKVSSDSIDGCSKPAHLLTQPTLHFGSRERLLSGFRYEARRDHPTSPPFRARRTAIQIQQMTSETLDARVCALGAASESSDFDSSVEAMNDLRFRVSHTRCLRSVTARAKARVTR